MAQEKDFAKIIAKCWSDPKFKEELFKNPEAVLKQNGIKIPEGKKIQVHENTSEVFNLVIPQKPAGQLAEKDLEKVAGGDWELPNSDYCV